MWELTQTAPTTDLYVVRSRTRGMRRGSSVRINILYPSYQKRQTANSKQLYTVVGTWTINPIPSIRDTWWLGTHRREQKNTKKCTSFTGIRTTFTCTAGLALARGYRISQTMSIIQGLSRIRDNGKREICGFRFCVL